MSSDIRLAFEGALEELTEEMLAELLGRAPDADESVAAAVAEVVAGVRDRGDEELRSLAERFDGATLASIEIPVEAWQEALGRLPRDLTAALETARDRIRAFHGRQVPAVDEAEIGRGIRVGRRPEPLRVVGAYAPGGTAAYPSSVLMCVVPAKIAGVPEVVVCSPPGASGAPSDAVLAACALADADRLFAIGGAGAVAALAYGTESVPRADKVVGPGNAYVTEAKRQLAGMIGSDCHAGPSEILIVADESADAATIAREMIAQAEHDPAAIVVAVLTDPSLPRKIRDALANQIPSQPRKEIIRQALGRAGALIVADETAAALEFASELAPEHLLLLVRDPRRAMSRVRGAGSVFLGPSSSVVFGDYVSGTNHVLPTGGRGRRQSGLSVADFVRWSTYQEIEEEAAARLAAPAATIAVAEGLDGHAAAARAWAGHATGEIPTKPPVRRRQDYADLTTYDPGRKPVDLDLSDNTNLFGQAPAARRVLESLRPADTRRYPSLYGGELKSAAAAYFGVAEECVATGCGSDDMIDACIRAFCRPTDRVTFANPTFSMIRTFARMNGVEAVAVDADPGFDVPVTDLLATAAQITYLCRPNNPTGNAAPRSAVERLVDGARGLVLIDEAYGDFFDDPLAAWAPTTDRAVVVRTMSKAFGLAGLRVGIAIGPPPLIGEIEKARGPYKVSVVGEKAAAAALREDAGWVDATAAEAVAARTDLERALRRLGLEVFPSATNFVLVAAPAGDAGAFAAALAEAGIGVRPFPDLPHAGDCVRITVGPAPLMERLVARIREILAS